jgi:dephospho-coA kinase
MKVIGITGGVGSGKTALLEYIRIHYNCEIILADEAAHHVEEPGQECYAELVELLTPAILNEDGTINKKRMSEEIFADASLLETVNGIIHPAVRQYILSEIELQRSLQQIDFLFIEAALLIECGYLDIVDDMWYIYAAEEIRRKRLKEARNYSDEKIDAIMQSQLSEEEYRKACHFVIDNSGELKDSFEQIDRKVREYL